MANLFLLCVELFWTAPENLRRVLRGERRQYTQPADIYSVAVILKEILCKNSAYEEELHMLNMSPRGQLVFHWWRPTGRADTHDLITRHTPYTPHTPTHTHTHAQWFFFGWEECESLVSWWFRKKVDRLKDGGRCGGGGFFLACEDFGRMLIQVSSQSVIPLFMPGSVYSGSASCDDCGRIFPDLLRVSSFPDRIPHYACKAA